MKTDLSLLYAIRDMNQEALIRLFEVYAQPLYKYARHYGRDPATADQIVGDVFSRLLNQLAAGNGPNTNLRSYLFESAHHLIVDDVRYKQRKIAIEDVESMLEADDSRGPNISDPILLESLSKAMTRSLTEYQRHVLILRFWQGYSLKETAEILGKSVNIIKAVQNRAFENLRRAIGECGW